MHIYKEISAGAKEVLGLILDFLIDLSTHFICDYGQGQGKLEEVGLLGNRVWRLFLHI